MGGILGGGGKKGDNTPVPQVNNLLDLQRQSRVSQLTPFGKTEYGSYDANGNFIPSNDVDVQRTELTPEARNLIERRNYIANDVLGDMLNPDVQFMGGEPQSPQQAADGIRSSVTPFSIRDSRSVEGRLPGGGNVYSVGTGLPTMRSSSTIETRLPGLDTDFSAQAERAGDAVFDSGMMRLRPQFDQQKQRLESDLFARGIPMSSDAAANEAGTGALDDMRRSQNDATQQLALASVLAGNDEASRLFGQDLATRQTMYGEQMGLAGMEQSQRGQRFGEQATQFGLQEQQRSTRFGEQLSLADMEAQRRNQALSEALAAYGVDAQQQGINQRQQGVNQSALQIGLGAGTPSPTLLNAPPAQGIDALSAYQMMQGAQTANAQARNSTKSSLLNAGGSIAAASMFSDIRLKENITPVGVENGKRIYEFNYKGQPERYRGVMAQEVPEATIVMPNGYLAVDYDKLGIKFRRAA